MRARTAGGKAALPGCDGLYLVRALRHELKECHGLAGSPVQARQLLRKLLVGRLVFTSVPAPQGPIYEISGTVAYDRLLAGLGDRPRGVVPPG